MVLFTKEVFLNLKSLHALYIQVQPQPQYPGQLPNPENWQIFIQGMNDSGAGGMGGGYDMLNSVVQCGTKQDAYRIYNELMNQVIQSGQVQELNNRMFENILTANEEKKDE